MIRIDLVDPAWVRGRDDDPSDQCAHGGVRFDVNGLTLLSPEEGEWTVSAAGLFLLRTLESDHTKEQPVSAGNFLFPCCGHALFLADGYRYGFVCDGCPGGVHIDVRREGQSVLISRDAHSARVRWSEWRQAVLSFTDQVQAHYDSSKPKVELDGQDGEAWALFWSEWRRRRGAGSTQARGAPER